MDTMFFDSAAELHAWLVLHHAGQSELVVGFQKKGSGLGGLSYAEALDEALCFGWIDGVRKGIDERSYSIRFTPRKRGSIWSAINIARAEELIELRRMQPAGRQAFEERTAAKSKVYSYENEPAVLAPSLEALFRANATAWAFFEAQPPSYRRTVTWWIMSAKREGTRLRRPTTLIASSEQGMQLS